MRTTNDIVQETKLFFDEIENISDKWDDAASKDFKDKMMYHCQGVAFHYAEAQDVLIRAYANYIEEARKLLDWKSGISLINLILHPFSTVKMVFHVQFSRLLTGRDYHFRP